MLTNLPFKMDSEKVEKEVISILKKRGFRASKIEERLEKTPDLRASDSGNDYVIEVKRKKTSKKEIERITSELEKEGVANHVDKIERSGTVSSIISGACKQIESVAKKQELRLVWFRPVGINKNAQVGHLLRNLYGMRRFNELPYGLDEDQPVRERDCYFFSNSDFYNFRNLLDGVIVQNGDEIKLHINSLSQNANRLKNSKLAKNFSFVNVRDEEGEDEATLIVDSEVDRSNEKAVEDFLREKYNLKLLSPVMVYSWRALAVGKIESEG